MAGVRKIINYAASEGLRFFSNDCTFTRPPGIFNVS
jgi:hypothetical protein